MVKTIFKTICVLCFVFIVAGNSWAAEPIRIGALFAVTGPPSFLGEPERNTANMMVDQINSRPAASKGACCDWWSTIHRAMLPRRYKRPIDSSKRTR